MSIKFKKIILLGALLALVQPVASMEDRQCADKSIHPLLRNRDETKINSTKSMEIKSIEEKVKKNTSLNPINTKKLELTFKGFDNLPTGRRSSNIPLATEKKTVAVTKKKKTVAKEKKTVVGSEVKLKRKSENIDKNIKKENDKKNKKRKNNKELIIFKENNNSSAIKETKEDQERRLMGVLVSSPQDWYFGVHAPLQGLDKGFEQKISISDDSFEG